MKENINHVDMIEMKTSAEKLPSYKLLTFFICSVIINNLQSEDFNLSITELSFIFLGSFTNSECLK
jgi:hypothetical protein